MDQPETTAEARLHNNFGILRLIFALLVLFSHSYPLATGTGDAEPLVLATGGEIDLGYLAVDGFFLISGFLITESWVRSRSASTFAIKRVLRIYPGYIAAFAVSLGIGAAGSTPSLRYIKNICYNNSVVMQALLFLDYGALDQPPAFNANPFPNTVNGSMWTLQSELKCYVLTLILGIFGIVGHKRATLIILCICAADYVGNVICKWNISHNMIRFLTFFIIGAAISVNAIPRPRLTPLRILIIFVIIVTMTQHGIMNDLGYRGIFRCAFALLYPVVFVYMLFGIAFARYTPAAALFSRYDFSYGIYLYAFPIQQTLVRFFGIHEPVMLFLAALPITVLLAWVSWRYVERPALSYGARLTKRM